MKDVLHIYDLGSYIHGGIVNKYAYFEGPVVGSPTTGWEYNELEAGPVTLVLKSIKQNRHDSDFVFCSDRDPTIKKEMYSGYKASRVYSPEIEQAKHTLERCLEFCGYDIYYDDGYEADDFVYSLVQKFKEKYRMVYVHTGDADLYTCVDKNVNIAKTLSNTKEVTMTNYRSMCRKGKITVYNLNSMHKVADGCRSDEIPPLNPGLRQQLDQFTDIFSYVWHKFGDRDFVLSMLLDKPELYKRVSLVYPLVVDVKDTIAEGNYQRVIAIGKLAHCNAFKHLSVNAIDELASELFIKKLCEEAM